MSEKRITRSAKHSTASNLTSRRMINDEIDVDERENIEIEAQNVRATELFDETSDISGKVLYKQADNKAGRMLDKAKSCVFRQNLNPVVRLDKNDTLKRNTPRKNTHDADYFMKGLTSESEESVSEDSEYDPENSDEKSTDEMEDESDYEDEIVERRTNEDVYESEDADDTVELTSGDKDEFKCEEKQRVTGTKPKEKSNIKKFSKSSHSTKKVSPDENDYNDIHLNTEEYFESQSQKILTSNRTLGRLKAAKLDKETIDKLLENKLHISDDHINGISRLNHKNVSSFPFWHFLLEEGFSLLLHGLGSKRNLIYDFYEQMIKGRPTLFVNGFFPSLTLKEILDGIIKDLMDLEVPTNLNDCMNLIEKTCKKHPEDKIYLIIHNIDGPMLRSKKIQDKLSYLASIPNIHLVASVDHINASLLWDNAKRSRYNFYWCNATTFLPYKEETLYENSLMVRQSGALVLSSLHNVFLSLPDKSRSVYIILVKYQIENANVNYQGMAFKDLYQRAREGFFVTNEITLRSQLTEFLDHKLVKEKRGIDGIQYLIIPLDNALLKQFLEQQEES